MISKDKRKKIQDLIYDFLTIVDSNSKFKNRNHYEAMFGIMTDDEFENWVKDMGKTTEDTINVYQMPWEEVSFKQIEEAAKFLNVPLEEYLYYRHLVEGVEVRTKYPVQIGYLNVKRLQQLLSKKNQYTFDTKNTDYDVGTVKGKSKVHHVSNSESYMLLLQNSKNAIKEFFGPRGSNLEQKKDMQNKISIDGWYSLKDTPKKGTDNEAINTLDMYITSSGLKSDLINPSTEYKTTFTKESIRKKISTGKG